MRKRICLVFLLSLAAAAFCGASLFCAEPIRKVRIGYYQGDVRFQNGFSDDVRKSGYAYEYCQKLASIAGWKYEYVYGSRAEIMDEIAEGKIDIVAGVYQTPKTQKQMLFSKMDIGIEGEKRYFAVNKNRPDLLDELNQAQEKLLSAEPDFPILLWHKYYTKITQQMLNEIEREWLAQKGLLKIGYVRHNLPLSDQDKNKNPTGVAKEVFDFLDSFLRIPIEPICYENIFEMETGLQNGEIDAAFPIYSDLWITESKGFYQTDSFVNDRVMIVYRGKYRKDLMDEIALSQTGIGQKHYLSIYYPESKQVFYDTREDAFAAVLAGKENCMIGCSSVLQHFLTENPDYQNFNVAYLNNSEDFGIAVSGQESRLVGILNKAVHQIDNGTITGAMIQYSNVEQTYSISVFIKRHAVAVVLILLMLFVIVLFTFLRFRWQTNFFNEEQLKSRSVLEDALAVANAANNAKTMFLSNMSHDIRTPMNGIMGMTAIAESHLDDTARVKDCLSKISVSGKHLLALINEVLDMSKIESGEMNLNEEIFELPKLIEELITINRPLANSRKQDLIVNINDISNKTVIGDSLRVQQVCTNLLSNAIKYTQEGGRIEFTLTQMPFEKQNLGYYKFVVKDNGIGMAKEFLPHLFEPFTRENDTAENEAQGTGLGMAITRNILRMMNGDISVKSEQGKGSEFTVTIFLKLPDKENAAVPKDFAEEKTENLQTNFYGNRALLAEDNSINAEIAISVLESAGLEVEWAENGKIALEKIANSAPNYYDCVFMDVRMPVMDGIEATKAIRALEREDAKHIPIFAVTANAFADDVQSVLKAGMNEHISKPIDFNNLLKVVGKYLKAR